MKKLMLAAAAALVLSGCAAPRKPIVIDVPFDAAAAEGLLKAGTNKIRGAGLLRQMGGGVVTCAGEEVKLIPATAYAKAYHDRAHRSHRDGYAPQYSAPLVTHPARYEELQKAVLCDAQGNFEFDDVADGDFLVKTTVAWAVPSRYGSNPQGGEIVKLVSVSGGKAARVVLTSN